VWTRGGPEVIKEAVIVEIARFTSWGGVRLRSLGTPAINGPTAPEPGDR
jgi:hypothetical protein